jgi:hypothetical protein
LYAHSFLAAFRKRPAWLLFAMMLDWELQSKYLCCFLCFCHVPAAYDIHGRSQVAPSGLRVQAGFSGTRRHREQQHRGKLVQEGFAAKHHHRQLLHRSGFGKWGSSEKHRPTCSSDLCAKGWQDMLDLPMGLFPD